MKNGSAACHRCHEAGHLPHRPKNRHRQLLGSAGADSGQYVQPGGFYAGRGDTIFVLDRGQARITLVSPSGAIAGIRSIKRNGVTSSSTADVDYQRVDSRGLRISRTVGAAVSRRSLAVSRVTQFR